MKNRRYEKIKEYTKVAREEFAELTGQEDRIVDELFLLMSKSLQGVGLTDIEKGYFWSHVDGFDNYVILTCMCNEIVEFMKGGNLPEEA